MNDGSTPLRVPVRSDRWRKLLPIVLIPGVGVAVVVGLAIGSPLLALAPVLALVGLTVLWLTPLRWSAALLLFLALSVDCSVDADSGLFQTPLAPLGDFLRYNLEQTVHLRGVKFSGLEVVAALLLLVSSVRRATGIPLDDRGYRTSTVLRDLSLLYCAAIGFSVVIGLLKGGSFQMWQVRLLLQIPFLFYFFQAAFRGPRDHAMLGRVVVAAGIAKALLSLVVYVVVRKAGGAHAVFTTNHGDSILFNAAMFVLIAHAAERTDRRRIRNAALLLPLLLAGMAANNRRLAYVDFGLGLLVLYVVTPWRPWKRMVVRTLGYALPVILLYVAVGWRVESGLFEPVHILRSLQSSRGDASTYWREVENYNIAWNMRDGPLLGIGLGRQYWDHIPNDDISLLYPEFRYWPHNSVLGLLLYCGIVGFTFVTGLFSAIIFLAMRSYRLASVPEDRAAAVWAVCVVLFCTIQAYGDIGAPFLQYRIFMALALAITGKLATATGAWPTRAHPSPDPPLERSPSGQRA